MCKIPFRILKNTTGIEQTLIHGDVHQLNRKGSKFGDRPAPCTLLNFDLLNPAEFGNVILFIYLFTMHPKIA